ncbi:hypothetical protein PRNP1_006057 [Phytophthora ramorum]
MASLRRLLKARRAEAATVKIAAKPTTIFDNQDMTAPYTQYIFKMRSAVKNSTKEEWKLRKRYSDFHVLHQKFRKTRNQWELVCLGPGEQFEAVVEILQQAAGFKFPRKHVRCDTSDIIHERRRRLMDYTRVLLAVYAVLDVMVRVDGGPDRNTDDLGCLRMLLIEIERFLEIPPKRKEVETRLTRTVLALGDVEATPSKADQCCICLSDSKRSGDGDKRMASLPCAHVFHEDCIIHWLLCSSTCPMCRRAVGHVANR